MIYRYTVVTRLAMALWFAIAIMGATHAQAPGDLPPEGVRKQLSALSGELQRAMNAGDLDGVNAVVARYRETIGAYAGVPESPEKIFAQADPTPLDRETLVSAIENAFDTVLSAMGSRSARAAARAMELREAAYVALVCIAAHDAGVDSRPFIARAREELDYLAALQDPKGFVPYPAVPGEGVPANVQRDVKRIRESHPEILRDGFLYYDDPAMQFDTACVGVAFCEGYRVTGDARYGDAARRAAAWAARCPYSANWNYNAFSVWLMARAIAVSDEREPLDRAITKARIGVLPGLMPNGRWVDRHNAKQTYHFIMVRSLCALVDVMTPSSPHYAELKDAVVKAAHTRAAEILERGVTNFESALWGLSSYVSLTPDDTTARQALTAVLRATLTKADATMEAFTPIALLALYPNPEDSAGVTLDESLARLNGDTWRGLAPEDRRREVRALETDLVEAMNAGDRSGVEAIVQKACAILGEYVAVPEVQPDYVTPPGAEIPPRDRVAKRWEESFQRMGGKNAFETAPPPKGQFQTGQRLRVTARHARAYLQSAEAALPNKDEFLAYALRGCDYLLSTQASTGVFGYPYDPRGAGLKGEAAAIVEKGQAQGLTMVEGGWVIDDLGTGGLNFDNGVVAITLLYAYATAGDARYLESARRAAEWAMDRPLCANWNYNAFSGWLLCRLYRVTGETRYLDEASRIFELGVLPGQLPCGRWFDQHNARIQYHAILLRAMVEFVLALEQTNDGRADEVRARTIAGLDNLAGQITRFGASNAHELLSTDALCAGLAAFGEHEAWRKALYVNINALIGPVLPQLEGRGMPMTETVAHYLLTLATQERGETPIEWQPHLGVPVHE